MSIFSEFVKKIKNIKNTKNAPRVACPKCGTVHDINADCKCPICGLKYKLPPEYNEYIEQAKLAANESFADKNKSGEECSNEAVREAGIKREKKKTDTLIKFSVFAVLFSALFLTIVLALFKDKDALIFKTGEYENQPIFYHTSEGLLRCAFPNDKSCDIGKGEVISYLSSANGKCVYLVYSGEFAPAKDSNYVLRISKFGKKVEKISESKDYIPVIISGGNNEYLYILTQTEDTGSIFNLTLSVDGEKPISVAKSVREVAVSTSGRYALISLDDNGTTKIMVYSAAAGELINPGIKNAHPLSIDNKGEYMIYARKNTADSTDIIVEKSTTERIEIPIFKNSTLKSVIFSEDRRTFAAEYTDKTVFYTCTDKDYSISNTYEGSLFGYNFNDNVCHNHLSFKEIPKISNVYGKDILPFYFYDKEHKFVYSVSDGGVKESVFYTHIIDNLCVSENGRCAFVADNVLYTGKLDIKNNDITKILTFTDKTLIDISPDGKFIYYKDADGNMFVTEYGKEAKNPRKIAVDPDIIKVAHNGNSILVISDNTASIIDKKGNSEKLCDNIDITLSVAASDDLSKFFYVTRSKDENGGEEKVSLYLYDSGKSKLISDKIADVCFVKDSARLDITKSHYVDLYPDAGAGSAESSDASQENNTSDVIPVPEVQTDTENAVPVPVPVSTSQESES